MKRTSSDDSAQQQTSRLALINTLLVMAVAIATVLGAVVLSTLGQVLGRQPDVGQSEGLAVDLIPTAVAPSPPPVTLLPTKSIPITTKPPPADLQESERPEETPSSTPKAEATATLFITTVPLPTSTPWPCADEKPGDWTAYSVEQGDTLFSLARRHATSMDLVIFYNCLDSTQLRAGQLLYLPPLPTPEPTTTESLVPELSPTSESEDLPPPQATFTTTPTQDATLAPIASATANGTIRPSPFVTLAPLVSETPLATATESGDATSTSTPAVVPSSTPVTPDTASATPTPTSLPTQSTP